MSIRQTIFDTLGRLRRLGAGWDGYAALAPKRDAIDDAARYVRDAPDIAFAVAAQPDGTVDLVHETGGVTQVLSFSGDGFAYVSERVGGSWREGAAYPI